MNKGSKIKNGLILSTNSFTRKEVLFLCEILNKKFKLKSTIHSLRALRALRACGVYKKIDDKTLRLPPSKDQYLIIISKSSLNTLKEIIMPYMHPSMKYKILY